MSPKEFGGIGDILHTHKNNNKSGEKGFIYPTNVGRGGTGDIFLQQIQGTGGIFF